MINIAPKEREIIINIIKKHLPDAKVLAYGSRVTGKAKTYSDLDLAINNDAPISVKLLGKLIEDLQESSLPYRVEIIDWHTISSEFQKIVKKDGEMLY